MAIEKTKDPERLLELQALQQAVASSDDRAQITNETGHNLGFFSRSKKDPADALPTFYVLAPGHQSDDDEILLALFVPADVDLSWGDQGHQDSASQSRVARVLEGEQLVVSSGLTSTDLDSTLAVDQPGSDDYHLNLPIFTIDKNLTGVASLPALSQEALDLEPETAPLD